MVNWLTAERPRTSVGADARVAKGVLSRAVNAGGGDLAEAPWPVPAGPFMSVVAPAVRISPAVRTHGLRLPAPRQAHCDASARGTVGRAGKRPRVAAFHDVRPPRQAQAVLPAGVAGRAVSPGFVLAGELA
jgi:hypothetical protein